MRLRTTILSTACVLALTGFVPAFAQEAMTEDQFMSQAMLEQIAEETGIPPEQAMQLSLDELAALKFNRGSSTDDEIAAFDPANPVMSEATLEQLAQNAGITVEEARTLSLNELGALVFNSSSSADEEIAVGDPSNPPIDNATLEQMAQLAGIPVEEARGMRLNELSALIFNKGSNADDQITVPSN